ncbi:DUF3105 domain-containing protein [Streptomyces sp. NPDC059991]|uniref:DUF3105 domain-containing protein n=1 Tax=Streptomyces sp. NPDC059991 TaxID=3347028 RepID=UPI0036CC21E0
MATKESKNSRQARIAEMRRAEQARERRNKIVAVTVSVAIVAGLVGVGAYLLNKESDDKDKQQAQKAADAKASIAGEKDWDPKKLGRNHVTKTVSYPMKPPVGGDHNQVWMNCGGVVYKKALPDMNAVHSLEHGAVWVTYNEKAPAADVQKLSDKVSKTPYSLMSPYQDQAGAIMLSAWGKQVTVTSADDPRVNQFFAKYVQGAQTPEPGAACTGGLDQK